MNFNLTLTTFYINILLIKFRFLKICLKIFNNFIIICIYFYKILFKLFFEFYISRYYINNKFCLKYLFNFPIFISLYLF